MPVLFEFKARSNRNAELEAKLQTLQPRFAGEDFQTDTYFNVTTGRLKLRAGNIENALIHYLRSNIAGSKRSDVLLYNHEPGSNLKRVLTAALGVKVIVEKKRRIWFVNNVKIHFDSVTGLGEYVEVEVFGDGKTDVADLGAECRRLADLFGVKKQDYVEGSYSDLLLSCTD